MNEEFNGIDEEPKVTPMRRPFHYWKVGDTEYKLKLTTSMIAKIEDKYRRNIIDLVSVEGLPQLSVMLTIIQGAISPWQHGIGYSDVQNLFDKWVDEGGSQMDLYAKVVMPTLAVSGFFTPKMAAEMLSELETEF